MNSRWVLLRNVLVLIGTFYASGMVFAGIWILALQITGSTPLHILLPLATALLTGVLCGYLLESRRPVAWAVVVGAFVALSTWSSVRWYIKPTLTELLPHGAESLGAGLLAGVSCWVFWRRRSSVATA